MIAIIPARGGSKGIPRKNIMDFCGLPLMAWSIKQGMAAGLSVFVSTEDWEIATVAKEFGAEVIPRPGELATDEAGMRGVLRHAKKYLNTQDDIVLLQPTSPLRMPGDINRAIVKYLASDSKYLSCCYAKICLDASAKPRENPPRQRLSKPLFEHGMLYIYGFDLEPVSEKECFLNQTPEWQSHEIDEPEDVEICEFYMRKKGLC